MDIIYEVIDKGNNNESQVKKGIYKYYDGFYQWLTYSRTGECKTLRTAYKKIGVEYK